MNTWIKGVKMLWPSKNGQKKPMNRDERDMEIHDEADDRRQA